MRTTLSASFHDRLSDSVRNTAGCESSFAEFWLAVLQNVGPHGSVGMQGIEAGSVVRIR